MLENPDFPYPGVPDFLLSKIPYVKLKGEWKGDSSQMRYRKDNRVPRYDLPAYQAAFRELNELLAAELTHPVAHPRATSGWPDEHRSD